MMIAGLGVDLRLDIVIAIEGRMSGADIARGATARGGAETGPGRVREDLPQGEAVIGVKEHQRGK